MFNYVLRVLTFSIVLQFKAVDYIDGFEQGSSISSALAMDILQSSTKPSMYIQCSF